MSINRRMDKEDVMYIYICVCVCVCVCVCIPSYTHDGILFSHKREHCWITSSDTDEPRVCHIE